MHSPSLREVQGGFWRAIASEPGTLTAGAGLLSVAAPSATLGSEERLRVYADAYFWRLRDILSEDFPRLAERLGDEAFEELATAYLRAHPSQDPSLRHLGDALPSFLARSAEHPPFLADLARLERARVDVFDAPDDRPLTTDDLRSVPPEAWAALRFVPIRALRVLHLDWPVVAYWSDAAAVPVAPEAVAVRVWRDAEFRVHHAVLSDRAEEALDAIRGGGTFEDLCAVWTDLPLDEGARRVTALLARWALDGILAAA
jgi:hypothetical protein